MNADSTLRFFVLCFVLLGNHAIAEESTISGVRDVVPLEISEADTDVVVLDVGTSGEYQVSHITNAINLDVTQESFKTDIAKLDPSLTYLLTCGTNASQGRAERAFITLIGAGFGNLENLEGGYVAWVDAGGSVSAKE